VEDKKIRTIFNLGQIHYVNYDGMMVIIFNNVSDDLSIDIVGCYQDKKKIVKRIKRDSPIWKALDHFRKVESGDIAERGSDGLQKIADYLRGIPSKLPS